MRKFLSIVLAVTLSLALTSHITYAEENISVIANNTKVQFDQPPVIINDRTLVPVRAISEIFNASVSWNDSTKTATVTKEFELWTEVHNIQIGSDKIYCTTHYKFENKTSNDTIQLDVPAQIHNGRTLIPLRAMSKALNAGCVWNGNTKTVFIGRNNLDLNIGLSESDINAIKSISTMIINNGLSNPSSGKISNWQVEHHVVGYGYFIYCIVSSTDGTDYMKFSFIPKGSTYSCESAFAYKSDPSISQSSTRYIYADGRYL